MYGCVDGCLKTGYVIHDYNTWNCWYFDLLCPVNWFQTAFVIYYNSVNLQQYSKDILSLWCLEESSGGICCICVLYNFCSSCIARLKWFVRMKNIWLKSVISFSFKRVKLFRSQGSHVLLQRFSIGTQELCSIACTNSHIDIPHSTSIVYGLLDLNC